MEGTSSTKKEESPKSRKEGTREENGSGENEVHCADSTPSFGPQIMSTESTDSVRTLRGDAPGITPGVIMTPSYPFPKMEDLAAGTPVRTPGVHRPFTALSPTVTPSLAKLAKSQISQDFKESGHLPSHHNLPSEQPRSLAGFFDGANHSKPNIVEMAVNIQSELGLVGWWNQVTQALKDNYGAERVTLAVATDSTDVENVPWAQLATFHANDEDNLSRATNEPQSSRSSLHDTVSRQSTFSEKTKDRGSSSNLRSLAFAASGSQPLLTRPKLESRHSYAGYPPRYTNASSDGSPVVAEPIADPPSPNRVSSFQSMRNERHVAGIAELKADTLHRHDIEELAKGPLSDDPYSPARPQSGRILQPVQPLESEADPLLTTAGVVKVLRRELASVLTREYHDQAMEAPSNKAAQHLVQKNVHWLPSMKTKNPGPNAPMPSPGSSRFHRPHKEHKVGPSAKAHDSSRRRSSGGSKLSSKAHLHARTEAMSTPSSCVYEDYEQYPGSSWAQSPAPSPAPHSESEESPFFSNLLDQDAFDEHPPHCEYGEPALIPAIGLDRAQSIIHLPLIHPSTTISQLQRPYLLRNDQRPKSKPLRHEKNEKAPSDKSNSPTSEAPTTRRTPIAIVSVLAPTVPYPPELVDSMNELAPLLATSFYAARSHTHMLLELNALSRRRPNLNSRPTFRDEQSLSNVSVATGLKFMGSTRDRNFSPASPSSTASTSTQSTATLHSPKGPGEGGSAVGTPAWDGQESTLSSEKQSFVGHGSAARSPGVDKQETRDDYFQLHPLRRSKGEPSSPKGSHRPNVLLRSASHSKKHVLHSQGATFANTQPSLPSATSSYPAHDQFGSLDVPQDVAHVFKEPSSSILKTMIDNGATQQFIAESETGNLVWANSKFLAYRNTSKENIHEQLWKNIYYKDVTRFRREWNKSLETGEQLSYQVRLKRFDGHHRWFHIRFLPLKDKYGLTKYWHGQAMDIHELHEAEVKAAKSKEKAASEAKYRAIANSLPVIVFAASVPTGMTFANNQWLSYSGQGLEEALGFGFLDHVHPEDLVKCRFPGVGSETVPLNAYMKSRANPLLRSGSSVSSTGESENTSLTETTIRDTSEGQNTPADIFIPNELLRGLASDGIIMCNKDEQGNLSITTEMRLKTRKGEYRWHLVQGSYIESVNFGQGEAQWFIACTDISNQKQNEAKIQDANSALETANLTLENEMRRRMGYLSSMSHEIRTPLNGIIGNLQFLINSGLNETNSEWAHSAQESAKNMHELINDILDLSKAEANMLQLSYAWFSPREIMEQVMDMLCSKASEKKIEFVCECSEAVPKIVRGDPGRIRQILMNLAGNAIKFTTYGEVVVQCDTLPRPPENSEVANLASNEIFVRWTVTDTGSGFTEDEKKLLFKPYSQIRNKSTRDTGGTGLGLILCKTMVTLHGGLIDATSKTGRGSAFTFFARFKARKGSAISLKSGMVSPTTVASSSGPQLSPSAHEAHKNLSSRKAIPAEAARESPAMLSDSSSAQSVGSTVFRSSVRSSVSTTDGGLPMPLTLPSQDAIAMQSDSTVSKRGSLGVDKSKVIRSITSSGPITKFTPRLKSPTTAAPVVTRTSPQSTTIPTSPGQEGRTDPERSRFRPPMLSILVICPAEQTRRVTCNQIKFVAPRSAPCNITSEARVDAAERLMHGDDPVTFTHVVFRVASDELLTRAVKQILDSSMHTQTCIVVLTDQAQVKSLTQSLADANLDDLNRRDRLKFILKPAHVYKLAKIFDPFNENAQNTADPKAAKRNEEKRLQKESYALFKNTLGNKGMRILAVEDNSVQMNVSHLTKRRQQLPLILIDFMQLPSKDLSPGRGTSVERTGVFGSTHLS